MLISLLHLRMLLRPQTLRRRLLAAGLKKNPHVRTVRFSTAGKTVEDICAASVRFQVPANGRPDIPRVTTDGITFGFYMPPPGSFETREMVFRATRARRMDRQLDPNLGYTLWVPVAGGKKARLHLWLVQAPATLAAARAGDTPPDRADPDDGGYEARAA